MLKTKELFISLIIFAIIAFMTVPVCATEGITADSLLDELNQGEVNDEGDDYDDEIGEGNRDQLSEDLSDSDDDEKKDDAKKDDEETEKKDETTSDEKLTHTGIEDFPVYIAIAVLGVSMVFAYKKVKEYNI